MAEAAKADVPPAQPNPEAIEDKPAATAAAPDARFQNVDLEAGKTTATTTTTTTVKAEKNSGLVQYADSWDYGTLNMALAFFSIVVMIASSIVCGGGVFVPGVQTGVSCTGIPAWQVSVSTISAIIAILTAVAYTAGALPEGAQLVVSGFQFLWWTAGMIVLTFFGSYQYVNFANGYFGTWAAYFVSGLALVQVFAPLRSAVDAALNSVRAPLLFLIVSSAVVMGAAIGPCSPQANCYSYNAWALSMGTISLGLSIILFLVGPMLPANALKGVAAFFFVWWAVGFCVSTFGGPFITPGNGYFASGASVLASIHFYRSVSVAAK